MPSLLPREVFLYVIEHAPLVAIDLVVRNTQGEVLLGWRTNRPAKDSWYTPGGRILKGETLDEAFRRVVQGELGIDKERAQARLLGVFEHFHPENFAGVPGITTHYVVLAYTFTHDLDLEALPRAQHSRYRWWPVEAALQHPQVHPYTKEYLAHL